MKVKQFASPPRHIEAEATLQEAAKCMDRWHVGSLIVLENGETVGMISDRDVALDALGASGSQASVRASMHAPLYHAAEGISVTEASRLLRDRGVRRLALTNEDGKVTGVVSADDLLQAMGSSMGALTRAIGRELQAEAQSDRSGSAVYGSE